MPRLHRVRTALHRAGDDLSRDGIVNSFRDLSGLDLEGLVAGPLDYQNPSQPPSRSADIGKVDVGKPGGTKTVAQGYESEDAKAYQPSQ